MLFRSAALSDKKGRATFISTPSGRNWFYDVFNLGQDEEDTEWKSWHFTTKDNPTIDPKEVDQAKKTLSSFAFKQEYEASFDNAGTDLFKEEWFKTGPEPQYGSYVIAIDLAGFESIAAGEQNKKRLDETAIAIVKVADNGDWWVKEVLHGRWDIKETCKRILMLTRDLQPSAGGMERGTLKNAALTVLTDMMRKSNIYSHIADLTHGNKKKTDRVVWALQGRLEHGRITFNQEEDWSQFKDQLFMFPTKGVHDDLVDALAYVDQLAMSNYQIDYEEDKWEPIDIISGY